jgi:hypothetical protein
MQGQYNVPTVRGLAQLTVDQVAEVQADMRIRAHQQCRTHWYDCRQNLRRPEDGLFQEGLIGISCEKPTPSDRETRRLGLGWLGRHSDDRAENWGYDADTPTRNQSFQLPEHDYNMHQATSS